ncbi:MAG: competence/damage-inducible protein A [Bdellovibrionales bacterium]
MENPLNQTSALLIIGNEILSGRTLDQNTQYIAGKMAAHGVPLREVRVVPDIEGEIVAAVNALRGKYDFVFTTGGIGPTHDDITAESIARAFDTDFGQNQGAYNVLLDYYGAENLTEARLRMARMPVFEDLSLILNPVSGAPGFRIANVFVMAGVPKIMQAMLDHVLTMITPGDAIYARTCYCPVPESELAKDLTALQAAHPDIDIGSYPSFKDGGWRVSVVFRGTDEATLEAVLAALVNRMAAKNIGVEVL